MTFDNSKTIISLRIKLFLATIAVIAYVAMAFVIKMIKFPLLGIKETIWTVALIGIWFILALFPMVLSYQYISYSDEGENIVFRYFSAGIAGGKKNAVQISKSVFSGYRIEKRLFGLIKTLVLFQRAPQGIAKYPPIYITALKRSELSKIISSLKQYIPQE